MELVEVFRTNVTTDHQAEALIKLIRQVFPTYHATFDLDDCDNILRISSGDETLRVAALISLIKNTGAHVEILPDEIPPLIDGELLLSTH